MNKKIILVGAVIALLLIAFFSGIIPGMTLLDNGDVTTNNHIGNLIGYGELLGPRERKGYIISYKNDGFSEAISVIGKVDHKPQGVILASGFPSYRYSVYAKENLWSDWEAVSTPEKSTMYVSNPNPGVMYTPSGLWTGGVVNLNEYSFEMVGNKYDAIRVVFEGYIDWNTANPFDDGFQWRTVQIDEAILYEGWGGLYLPTGSDGRFRDTFEIGETVNIRVKTTYGGQAVDEGKTWRVVLREPPSRGGDVIKTVDYGDNVDAYFTFTVTDDMWVKGADNGFTLEIFNTLVPQGTLFVDTIDFIAKAPSEVYLSGSTQAKVGSSTSVELSANVNSDTQLAIDHFRVSVIYGNSEVLLPSDPLSHNWIISTTSITASKSESSYKATVTFKAEKESWVTVHAKAFDTDGRGSPLTKTWTLWAYEDSPADEDAIADQTGENDYGGGHTDSWLPWDPGGGNWEEPDLTTAIIAFAIILFGFIIAFFSKFGKKYNLYIKIGIMAVFIAIALAFYYYY